MEKKKKRKKTMTTQTKTNNESISLYYKEGGSDKVYHVQLVEHTDKNFVVNFQYGRRGQSLQTGTKTNTAVTYDKAKKIFDKLVQEKKSKGYTEGEAGTPYSNSDKDGLVSGYLPQLLNPIEEEDITKYINDHNFFMQEKFDGRRLMIKKEGNEVVGINRKGLFVDLPENIVDQLRSLIYDFVIDGELIGDKYHVFDLIEHNGCENGGDYDSRIQDVHNLKESAEGKWKDISVVETARDIKEKTGLFNRLKREQAEGIVFKDRRSMYKPGRPNSGGPQLKFKFYSTASVEVIGINDKRSVQIAVLDNNVLVDVGNVTIPPNKKIPKKGDIVEVRYLNYQLGGSLYQPVYLNVRDDIDAADQLKTLKLKATTDEE